LWGDDTCYAGCMKENSGAVASKYYAGVGVRENGTLYWLLTDPPQPIMVGSNVMGDAILNVIELLNRNRRFPVKELA
jgi:hypothetical protein